MFLSHRGGQTMEMNIVTVYDIQNKFIAYSAPFPDVIDVLSEWGCVYILGGDRKVRFQRVNQYTWSYTFVAVLGVTASYVNVGNLLFFLNFYLQIYQLQEKDTQTKLEMLFKKNNYTLAIR